ncbi:MAG: sulfite exporter TauE/SafE family protein [Reinekea sp.]|jgi:uncharacterized protein
MPTLLTDSFFYLCAIPAVLIFGLSKGGFGGAIGILSVPLMAFSVSPPQAAAILLPILCAMDIIAIRKYWRRWHRKNLLILIPASIIGIVIGSLTFRYLSDAHIRILIGLLALGFSLYFWFGQSRADSGEKPSVSKGRFWGMVAGFTSFGVHAGGPPVSIYLLPQRLPPTEFVATTAALFGVINYTKLVPYFWLGQLTSANFLVSLVLLPLAPIGISLGYYLHDKIPVKTFYQVSYFFLMLAGIKLLYEGVMAI